MQKFIVSYVITPVVAYLAYFGVVHGVLKTSDLIAARKLTK